MPCAPNEQITWPLIKEVSERIDALAVSMETPGYTPLVDEVDMPFDQADKVPFNGAIRFAVTPGTITVTLQHLCAGLENRTAYALPDTLEEMGKVNDLYLVVTEDGCWCSTIFKVNTNPGVPQLEQIAEMGCCQSLPVPLPGDLLDDSQHFISPSRASRYAEDGNPVDDAVWQIKPACVAETVDNGFRFAEALLESPFIDATRELSGYFTWPERKRYMDKMIEKLNSILDCESSGGAKLDTIRKHPSTACGEDPGDTVYIPEGCPVTLCDLVNHCIITGTITFNPGCVRSGCVASYPSPGNPTMPWDTVTCGGQKCAQVDKPKFYCKTLTDLAAILDIAEDGLRPFDPPSQVCHACDCYFTVECYGKRAMVEHCWWADTETTTLRGYEDQRWYCDYDTGNHVCTESDFYDYVEGMWEFCGGVLLESGGCSQVLRGGVSDTSCDDEDAGYPCGGGTVPIIGGPLPWSTMQSRVNSLVTTCAEESADPCAAFASTFFNDPLAEPAPIFGLLSGFAEKQNLTRWRARLVGSYDCDGSPGPLVAKIKKTSVIDGVTTEEILDITCNWDAGEMTFVSSWMDQAAPAWPTPRGTNSITFTALSCNVSCPCPSL